MLGLILAILGMVLSYKLYVKKYFYFQRNNVPQSRAPLPLFGDQISAVIKTKSFCEFVQYMYGMFPGARYAGVYQMVIPTLLVRDPELIKQMGVKDFDHFTDHSITAENIDPLLGKNLFSLKGDQWRRMRATLSPTFTSSKMKLMFILMSECATNFVDHFDKKMGTEPLTLDMKDVFTRFTNDVIATTAFGIKCDSLADRTNPFYMMAKEATNFTGFWTNLKLFVIMFTPKFARLLNLRLFDQKLMSFFSEIISETIKAREEKHILRPDMIHLLMEARKGKNKVTVKEESQVEDTGFAAMEEHIKPTEEAAVLTDSDITGQAMVFFFAGFDTVSTLMAFTSYELAVNPDVQERLQNEVDETYDNCNGKLTYEALMSMKYLDMVISESLRKWPIAIASDRACVKPYTIQPKLPEEPVFNLHVGDMVLFPTFAIHRDEQYYANPEKFDPERFNDENKLKISQYTYMPFGVGPRNCIGSRFALLETKLIYFHILRNFTLVPVEKTQVPIKVNRKVLSIVAEKGHWIGMKRRNNA